MDQYPSVALGLGTPAVEGLKRVWAVKCHDRVQWEPKARGLLTWLADRKYLQNRYLEQKLLAEQGSGVGLSLGENVQSGKSTGHLWK